ncbi:MAG: hypothetical protein CML20_04875 [Rheinheimera sp.]|uniref:hypothetical protein n=1 Tax=Arsukibacterium sp. UBA3155 TaxID=1946058 RepID=UPI000C981FA4|nr:hypothetical protein [Arsukibacterium sp. UBA3155]MAD74123.1 hypothetical protein [Rheinheimera sp.]
MEDVSESKFCDQCGWSLTPLLNIHQSKKCNRSNCDKIIFFESWGEGGGLMVEKGNKLHFPAGSIKISLDPRDGRLTEFGLKGFIKDLFRGPEIPKEKESFLEFLIEQEKLLDTELSELEWINHLDLFNPDDSEECSRILKKESEYYLLKLYQSSSYGEAHRAYKSNDFEKATRDAYCAHVFHCLATLKLEHLDKIITLGYDCYHDMVTNELNFDNTKKEKLLIAQLARQVQNIDDLHLHVWLTDEQPILPRIHAKGISENTAKRALEFEKERRRIAKEESKADREHNLKSLDVKTKIFLAIVPIVTGAIGFLLGS